MPNAVISDASCLIILHKIGALEILRQIYGEVITTPEIESEVRFLLPRWVVVKSADQPLQAPATIDIGEANAIALALEIPDSILIIDDRAARKYAKRLGLHVTGTLGVIVKAKLDGVIPSIQPYVVEIRKTDFRFSSAIEADAFEQAGEGQQ